MGRLQQTLIAITKAHRQIFFTPVKTLYNFSNKQIRVNEHLFTF